MIYNLKKTDKVKYEGKNCRSNPQIVLRFSAFPCSADTLVTVPELKLGDCVEREDGGPNGTRTRVTDVREQI